MGQKRPFQAIAGGGRGHLRQRVEDSALKVIHVRQFIQEQLFKQIHVRFITALYVCLLAVHLDGGHLIPEGLPISTAILPGKLHGEYGV